MNLEGLREEGRLFKLNGFIHSPLILNLMIRHSVFDIRHSCPLDTRIRRTHDESAGLSIGNPGLTPIALK